MSRAWGIANGLSPVSYVNTKSVHADAILSAAANASDSKITGENLADFVQMLAFTKPISGLMNKKNGTPIDKDFYSECEWRYMPKFKSGSSSGAMSHEKFTAQKHLDSCNETMRNDYILKFKIDDIEYIFVKDESDVPVMHDFISTNPKMGENSSNGIKRLTTRITSLTRLVRDI